MTPTPVEIATRAIGLAGVGTIAGGAVGAALGEALGDAPTLGAFLGGVVGAAVGLMAPRTVRPKALFDHRAAALQSIDQVVARYEQETAAFQLLHPGVPVPQDVSSMLVAARSLRKCLLLPEGDGSICTPLPRHQPMYLPSALQLAAGVGICGAAGAAGGVRLGERGVPGHPVLLAALGGAAGVAGATALTWATRRWAIPAAKITMPPRASSSR